MATIMSWGNSSGTRGRCDAHCLNYQTKLLWCFFELASLFIFKRILAWPSRYKLKMIYNIKGATFKIIKTSFLRQAFNLFGIKKMVVKEPMMIRTSKENIIPGELPSCTCWDDMGYLNKPIKATEDAFRTFLSFFNCVSITSRKALTSIQALCFVSANTRAIQSFIIALCSSLNRKFFPTESTDLNIFERLPHMSGQVHALSLAIASRRTKLLVPRRHYITTYRTKAFHISSLSQCNCNCN